MQATFRVSLKTQPTGDVTLALSSSNPNEGTVGSAQLVFTPVNWAAEQVVTVTGKNDDATDGPQVYRVVFAPAQSTDAKYAGKKPSDVEITNVDDDTAGVLLTGATDLFTSEPDVATTFQISLTKAPTSNVTIGFTSSNIAEVTVSPASVTFTPQNWSGLQIITLRGVNDTVVDGPQTVTIVTAPAISDDPAYNGFNAPDITAINRDDDPAAFIVRPTSGLITRENGSQASFTVRLNTQPTAPVSVAVTSSDTTEARVWPATLTFTTQDWASPHTVIVTGVDDMDADGNQGFTISLAPAMTTDTRINGLIAAPVSGTNIDNDSPGITVTAAPNLEVNENGGTATFTVELNYAPTADVTIPVSSSNTMKATVAPASLVFTRANWNAPRTVTITGVDNMVKDGRIAVNILLGAAMSSDTAYANIDPTDVTVFVRDDETQGITVRTPEDFFTNESGRQTTFTVVLNARPSANVVLPVASLATDETTAAPAQLTFTPNDWNSPHTVTLTGVDDTEQDGTQEVTIRLGPTTSSDAAYLNLEPIDVLVENRDNDSPGVTVIPTRGLVTNEDGAQATFDVELHTPPTSPVTFTLAVTEPAEASVSPATLTFTSTNWNARQRVTLTGLDDMEPTADGNRPYLVTFSPATSDDAKYRGFVVPNVEAINNDNDTPGVTIGTSGPPTTAETGTQTTFTVRLNNRPLSNVTLPIVSSRPSEGTVSVASLTFTPVNWAAPQAVTVTGVDDEIDDGPQLYTIQIGPAVADDSQYNGLVVPGVEVTNTDNDTANVTVAVTSATRNGALLTNEASLPGTQGTFTVVLTSEPTAPVTIPIASNRPSEATVSPSSLTFTPGMNGNWNAPQTVTVTGQGDLMPDGPQPFQIVFGPISGGDATYTALTIPNLQGLNIDNDSAEINVFGDDFETTEQGAGQDSFQIVLGAPPTSDVIVPITVSRPDEVQIRSGGGLVTTLDVTFTPADYTGIRVITIEGVDDLIADGNQAYQIAIGPARSLDPQYAGRIVPSLDGTNIDNDSPGVRVVAAEPLATDEFGVAGATPSFTVALTSQPTAPVTIQLSSTDVGEGTVSPASLVFNAGNWSTPRTVTLTGVNDDIADGSQPYFIVVGPITSGDPNYNNRTVPNVSAFNTDNDFPGLTVVAPTTLATNEGGATDTFTIRLNSEPTAAVTITIASTVPTEASVDNPTLLFDATNWSTAQTVTVRGVNDDFDDLDQPYQITISATSVDPNYVRTAPNLNGVNDDDDTAGFIRLGAGALTVQEPNQSATFTLRLRSQPTADVTIPMMVSDPSELSVSPTAVVFTTANWNVAQTITVTAINDDVADSTQTVALRFGPVASGDTTYAALTLSDVSVDVTDDDSAGVLVSKTSVVTFEVGVTDTFTVRLSSEPSVTTTIAITSSDTTEATVSPALLTFTATDWQTPQTVTVTGVQDAPAVLDGDVTYNIQLAAPVGAPEYAALASRTIAGENFEAFLTCRELQTIHPAATNGVYWLDTDRAGALPKFRGYCDLTSAGGGWTLLSWAADTDVRGVPYPGLVYCADPGFNCARASGVPSAAEANALFVNAREFGQGQAITINARKATFAPLAQYEYAGRFDYGALTGFTLEAGAGTCAAFSAAGTYTTISDPSEANRNNGVTVFLNQGLRVADDFGDFSADTNSYRFSIGNRTANCVTNGTPPASIVGTWQATQYGPTVQASAGSYSVWVR